MSPVGVDFQVMMLVAYLVAADCSRPVCPALQIDVVILTLFHVLFA